MKELNLSQRAFSTQASPIRKLVPYAEEAKRQGVWVYHLNIGQPDIETPDVFFKAVHTWESKVVAYGHSKGMIEFREALRNYYHKVGINVSTEEIQVTTGGSEAIVFAFMAICDPDDEIIVFEPFYTNYNSFAVMAGVKLVPITTEAENGFHLPSKEDIEKHITERTRGIMICTPNNPTGTVLTSDEMKMLGEIVKEHNLYLLSDEVYREFVYEGNHFGIMELEGIEDRAIMLDSLSKRYSLCGARIGCLVSRNHDLMDAILRFAQARLCPPTLEQIGAQAVLGLGNDYFEKLIAEYQKRRDIVFEAIAEMPDVLCLKPAGAFYCVARLPIDNTDNFAKWLLTDFRIHNETTMIAPAAGFYATDGLGTNEIRIAYVLNSDDLKRAMHIVAEGIIAYNKR